MGLKGELVVNRAVVILLGSLLILGGLTVWLMSDADSGAPEVASAIDDWAADPGEDSMALPVGTTPQGTSRLPAVPGASTVTKEQRRFARYDRDRDGVIGRDEMLSTRVKAFKTLDTNGDGFLAFEEWSIATAKRFDGADRDRSKDTDTGGVRDDGTESDGQGEVSVLKQDRSAPPPPSELGE